MIRRPPALATALVPLALLASTAAAGCGEDSCTSLSGSAAQGLSLSYDDLTIQHFSTGPSLVFKYSAGSAGYPAILSVNSAGTPFESGLTLDFVGDQAAPGEPAHAFGNATRQMEDGQQFGEVEGGTLTLDSFAAGGDAEAEGNIGFRFKDGKSLRGQFCAGVTEIPD